VLLMGKKRKIKISWKCTVKGTVQQDILPLIFSRMGSSQAPYWVSEGFSNLASNLRRYARFFN
jgi:hypothetical protein